MSYVKIKEWKTKAGLNATICKPFGTYLCGYVELPKTHKLYIQKPKDKEELKKWYRGGCSQPSDTIFDVHGGITYKGWRENKYEYGFDCAHYEDMLDPKDEFFCIEQCEELAEQLVNFDKFNKNHED